MGIVKATKLIFEYVKRDEQENIEEVKRAIDNMDVDIKKGVLMQFWGITDLENLPLPSRLTGFSCLQEELSWCPVWIPEMRITSGDIRKTAGMVFQNSGQSDYRKCGGGRCGIRTGEFGGSHR